MLARKVVSKCSSKAFKATVAMSEEFPMKVEMLLAVLEVIAPQFKHFNKLRDFVNLKLPPGINQSDTSMLLYTITIQIPGFPIQVNIPVLPTVSAKVLTNQNTALTNKNTSLHRSPSPTSIGQSQERSQRLPRRNLKSHLTINTILKG